MGFSRQEYWSGLPVPSPGDLPDPDYSPTQINFFFNPTQLGNIMRPWEGTRQIWFMNVNLWIWILSGIYVTYAWQKGQRESGQEGLPGCWSHFLRACGALFWGTWEGGEKASDPRHPGNFGSAPSWLRWHSLGSTWTARTERGDTSLSCLSRLPLAFCSRCPHLGPGPHHLITMLLDSSHMNLSCT